MAGAGLVEASDAEFREKLEERFTIVEIPGKGNCFFSALAERLHESHVNQMICRQNCFSYLNEHLEEITDFVDLDNKELADELDAILRPKPGRWGGHLAIYAACNYYGCNIHILQPNSRERVHSPVELQANSREIYLSYHNGVHYNLLVPRDDEADKEKADEEMDPRDDDINVEDGKPTDTGEKSNDNNDNEMDTEHEASSTDNSSNGDGQSTSSGETPSEQDEISYAEDSSEMDDDDSTENPILDHLGFPFVAHGLYKKARDEVTIAILVQTPNLKHRTLLEALEKEKPEEVYMVTLYNKNDVSKLCTDTDLKTIFTVYIQNFGLPDDPQMHDRNIWLSNALVLPILLSVIGYSWNNLNIVIMCQMTRNGKPAILLDKFWPIARSSITEDLEFILTNPAALFCKTCLLTCPLRQKRWHSDLSQYRLKEQSDENHEFVRRFSTFEDPNFHLISPIMDKLGEIKRSPGTMREKLENLKVALDRNAEVHSSEYFSTYLVLLMDGRNISTYGHKDVNQMLNDPDVVKAVYVGQTSNAPFRVTHFTDPCSSINKALSKTSRLYYIRQKKFSTKRKAEIDEAILIEILKGAVKDGLEKSGAKPFLLLNQRSESRSILPIKHKERVQISSFRTSGIPVFRTNPTNLQQSEYKRFRGNYEIKNPVQFQPGTYQFRSFDDDTIQDYYNELGGRLPN